MGRSAVTPASIVRALSISFVFFFLCLTYICTNLCLLKRINQYDSLNDISPPHGDSNVSLLPLAPAPFNIILAKSGAFTSAPVRPPRFGRSFPSAGSR
jgi:hypothetical protein